MKHRTIQNVMTADVVHVGREAPFKQVAELLAVNRISGLPVVDDARRVVGVISETDLMERQAAQEKRQERERKATRGVTRTFWRGRTVRRRLSRRARRRESAKSRATTAGQLMSAPPVTVRPSQSVTEAARVMAEHSVERLPVVDDEGRLVGIVTRHDLLRVFLRRDAEIRAEVVNEVLIRTLWLTRTSLAVTVHEGVVTLEGQVERRSEIPIAVRMCERIDGVVSVVDKLTYRLDDSHLQPTEQAMRGLAEDWLRKM
ncbi:CBS domain-containing protein [Streptomyces sp. ODS28]|uniref:CBS domain-containing protein n=1 Tax=Streptomyces sp. ODS28 TaxID=3136688 RepID=UPI0031E95C3D